MRMKRRRGSTGIRRGTSAGRGCRRARGVGPVGIELTVDVLVDTQTPREGRRGPEELLVEPVAPPAHGLGEDEPGGRGVEERQDPDPLVSGDRPRGEHAEGHGTPDPETAVPDLQRVERVPVRPEVRVGGGEDVVEASADDAGGHRDDRDVPQVVLVAAAGAPAPRGQPQGEQDAREDAECVGVDRQRADREAAPARGGISATRSTSLMRGPPGVRRQSVRRAGTPPSSRARMRAEPTMTPSA